MKHLTNVDQEKSNELMRGTKKYDKTVKSSYSLY